MDWAGWRIGGWAGDDLEPRPRTLTSDFFVGERALAHLVIPLVALLVAALTLFSGFGLGTLLMPAFALFFPLPVAIAATAVVHLANNLFKILLVGRSADRVALLRFALPAALAAFAGAWLLTALEAVPPILSYAVGSQEHRMTPVKLVIGVLIVGFALLELLPRFETLAFDRRHLALGGLLSGFFGGLSGHQGAFRSAFLIKVGLSKEAFIGTGVVAAVIVDAARLLAYGVSFYTAGFFGLDAGAWPPVLVATLAAFIGSFLGVRLIGKVTLRAVQILVGWLLILVGLGLSAGFL